MTRSATIAYLLALLCFLMSGCPGTDRTPPEVAIVSPAPFDTVRGTITVVAEATDNDRVVEVKLVVNGSERAADSTPEGSRFEIQLNTAALTPNTLHDLRCDALDPAGNTGNSTVVQVYVQPGTVHSGTISADETWRPGDNPHIVEGPLLVQALLELEPGVEVQLRTGASIEVGSGTAGAMRAAGESGTPIRFTSNALTPAPGDWNRLAFLTPPVRDSNVLRHCIIEFGGGQTALVCAYDAELAVESCSLQLSAGHGLVTEDSGVARLTGNAFADCAGVPVAVEPMAVTAVDTSNRFHVNGLNGIGILGGNVTSNTIWSNRGMPYYILDFVGVAGMASPALTIGAGCSLLFADSAGCRVGVGQTGSIAANGSSELIYFGPLSSIPGTDHWQGLEFWSFTDPLRASLRNCVIDRAGDNGLGAVVCYAPLAITGTRVTGSASAGVNCVGTGFNQFVGNTVTGCDSYPLVIEAPDMGSVGGDNDLSGNARDSILVNEGRIIYTSQWRDHGVPYLVRGEVSVGSANSPTLVIDNGVTVAFGSNAALVVGRDSTGSLICRGTPDSITLTAVRDTAGVWRGVKLYPETISTTTLFRCRLLYGGRGGEGILYINGCRATVMDCEIGWSSSYCILLWNTTLIPDVLRGSNWLHDWDPDYDDIEEGP